MGAVLCDKALHFFWLQGDGARENRNLFCLRKVMTVGWCKWQLTEVSDLGSHGLKGQQHLAQGKRSGTLGIVCWSSHAL